MKSKFHPAVALQIRLPLELREKLETMKEKTGKSVNQIIVQMVEEFLNDNHDNDMEDSGMPA
ncbi:Arc family DNA-binding protein [Pelotomaculum propionicicum]|uniref:Arc-like DNA binding domain-containing protein n=1 Tax=Pelotomaculum propionicicum TaxID=258475 RepID=A0A4Y7RL80_9FIRM|nr:Arc family DNA-binding protein [Pelotomaculum propionicicum]TEB09725.1 hypothetical protein Pmgp_02902 [Pelotomaculum propionicicum]